MNPRQQDVRLAEWLRPLKEPWCILQPAPFVQQTMKHAHPLEVRPETGQVCNGYGRRECMSGSSDISFELVSLTVTAHTVHTVLSAAIFLSDSLHIPIPSILLRLLTRSAPNLCRPQGSCTWLYQFYALPFPDEERTRFWTLLPFSLTFLLLCSISLGL